MKYTTNYSYARGRRKVATIAKEPCKMRLRKEADDRMYRGGE